MNYLKRPHLLSGLLLAAAFCAVVQAAPAKPPAVPAKLDISVSPGELEPGAQARVLIRLEPIEGVKINRYPKIKLSVPAQEGLVEQAKAEIGNDSPPPPDKMETNYYKTVDPVELDLVLSPQAPQGKHEVEGTLKYFYCVTKSGFCAPKSAPVKIPIVVK